MADDFTPTYEHWRHGGWYVTNVQYVTGAVGCVSRNYPDRKWRIVEHRAPFAEQPTFPNRDAAARAERDYARSPEVVAADLATARAWQQGYIDRGVDPTSRVVTQFDRLIAEGERLLAAAGQAA